jgi:membrane protease YdiL (CAAX protease family)
MFQSWSQPEFHRPVRIPHMGHVAILAVFAFFGLMGATLGIRWGLKAHLYGVTTMAQAITDIHFTLGSEVILYLLTFAACLIFFPMIWQKGFFAGIQWNGATALHLRQRLFITAAVCFALALINGLLLPGPSDAPIDKIFRAPGAAWLLFAFGVTFAPFFEEMVFRGFLLPALCTACDWLHEKTSGVPVRPLDETDQPRWSIPAMVIASILTSVPFAGMHAAQTGYSLGPFILLIGVSLALCWARLSTRSLAASVMVHASYNFLLFFLMAIGTEGFKHLDKM